MKGEAVRIKALIFDLDDTLLNREKSVSEKNVKAISELIKRDRVVIICTSRPLRFAMDALSFFNTNEVHVLTLNGQCYNYKNRNVIYKYLGDESKVVFEKFKQTKSIVSVEADGVEFTCNYNCDTDEMKKYQSLKNGKYVKPTDFDWNECTKLCIDGNGSSIAKEIERLKTDGYQVVSGLSDTFLNVVPIGFNKWEGIRILLSELKIDSKDCIAFGDDDPDKEMLMHCGIGVCMSNSSKGIKEIADVEIGDCDSDSIAEYLDKIFNT